MAYNYKKQVRQTRKGERELHKEAMQIYYDKYNKKGAEHKPLNRNTIKRIKKHLVFDNSKFQCLRVKFNNIEEMMKMKSKKKL